MNEKSNHNQLKQGILEMSSSKIWDYAILEWKVTDIYKLEDGENYETCLCGHYPIRNICVITNLKNSKQVIIGNICVKQFISNEPDKIFLSLDQIIGDNSRGPNRELIQWVNNKGGMSDYNYKFCMERFGKKKFSEKQKNRRILANQEIINFFLKKG